MTKISSKLFFDIETDGLYDEVTKCWLICIKDETTGKEYSYYDDDIGTGSTRAGTISEGLDQLSGAEQIIGHNIIGYDIPVLKKLYGWGPTGSTKVTDTLVLSRLFLPDRDGGHSLRAWGERLGFPKGLYDDWTGGLSEDMVTYCQQDVRVTEKLYGALKQEIKGQKWGESIGLEHAVAKIIAQQEVDGCLFDLQLANDTITKLTDMIEQIAAQVLLLLPLTGGVYGAEVAPYTKTGALSARAKALGDGYIFGGPFKKVLFKSPDLNSIHQMKAWLESIGWVPTEFTPTGGGKLTEDSFDTLPDKELGKKLAYRVQCKHRIGQIQGWIDVVRRDGRISAQANTIGTPTGRFRHKQIVNVPAACTYPKGSDRAGELLWMGDDSNPQPTLAGTEMRAMFKVSPGFKMVGHDASGLELRMFAHYINDPVYTEILLNGDIHSHNQELAGLHTRASAKTFIYAFLYGAGDAKLGSIVEGGESEGAALRARFLRENPQLNKLINKAKRAARERGYLIGLDGRRIWLRRDERGRVLEHKALNTLLQCAGAVVMKKSMTLLDQWAREEGLVFKKVIDMHDEGQAEVWEPHAERYAELAVKSIVEAGKHFNLNVPLDGEAKIDNNWAGTH